MKLLSLSEFINEKYTLVDILLEGGAAGHMSHPFNDNNLRFIDFKNIVDSALQGGLDFEEAPTEKTDGQNLLVSYKDGEVIFARNKGQLSNPITVDGIIQMFRGHDKKSVEETFILAARDLDKAIKSLRNKDIFNNGKSFMNIEVIYTGNPNVINYDRGDLIQFHNIYNTDGQGKVLNVDTKPAREIVKMLKDINSDVQDTFSIVPPQILKLKKDIDFEKRKSYYFKKINQLRDKFNLRDSDEVRLYHEHWWKEQIEEHFSDLPQNVKDGLLLRWVYEDKQTLNMRSIAKLINKEQIKKVKEFDKKYKKKQKENILPFENLFLELGADVLKNASNFVAANPEKEKQRLQQQIRKESENIKKNGDLSQIDKVERELKRLQSIGGIESVIPSEGIVFKYKGNTYKLTGAFAAINQLLGIIKFMR